MAIAKGLLAGVLAAAAGGVFLWAAAFVSAQPVAAELAVRLIGWLALAIAALRCGYLAAARWRACAWRLAALLAAVVVGAAVWFAPALVSGRGLCWLAGALVAVTQLGGCFGANLAWAKKARDEENNLEK